MGLFTEGFAAAIGLMVWMEFSAMIVLWVRPGTQKALPDSIPSGPLAGIVFELHLKSRPQVHSIHLRRKRWRESGLRPKAERLDFPYCEHY